MAKTHGKDGRVTVQGFKQGYYEATKNKKIMLALDITETQYCVSGYDQWGRGVCKTFTELKQARKCFDKYNLKK